MKSNLYWIWRQIVHKMTNYKLIDLKLCLQTTEIEVYDFPVLYTHTKSIL